MASQTTFITGGAMIFHFSQPAYFLLLLPLIIAVLYTITKAKSIMRLLSTYTGQNTSSVHAVKIKLILRSVFWSLGWVCMCVALAGPSWGTELVPVQRSGRAVSFVFDISYSMMAKDIQGDSTLTRLESSKQFAQHLLGVLPGVATSAVLSKGDGVLAVPLTEDYYALSNLITSLSPTMLSHPGSSLSKGILKAIDSFPPQSARSSYIIVLSDGDDTDENLSSAVDTAVSFGIHVIFVGFGSQVESEVIAGDGVTRVKTALRADKLELLAQKNTVDTFFASEQSSISDVVNIIKPSMFFTEEATTTGYEVETIKRHGFFIALALILFFIGFLVYVFAPSPFFSLFIKNTKASIIMLFILSGGLFTGCSEWFVDAKDVLEGSYAWTRQEYQDSVASFLEVSMRAQEKNDLEILQYGLYGLSSNYIMQGEMDASLAKINEMSPVVPTSLDFARWYNKGIIFHRRGDYTTAAFCFKKALLIDSTNIQAKINLELCLDDRRSQAQQGVQERIPTAEKTAPAGADDAIFSLIRENEENQWKNKEVSPEESGIIDY